MPDEIQPKEGPKTISGRKQDDFFTGEKGNWKVVSAELDAGKVRVENQETYDTIFVVYKNGKWSCSLLNKDNKKVTISSPDFEKLIGVVIKIWDDGGKIINKENEQIKMKKSEIQKIIREEIQNIIEEARYEQPEKGKKTPDDINILIPGFGVVKHSTAKKELIRKIEDLMKRAKQEKFSTIGKGNFDTLTAWWDTLSKHSGE